MIYPDGFNIGKRNIKTRTKGQPAIRSNAVAPKASPTILIYQGEKIIPVSFDDMALLYLQNGIVTIRTFSHQVFMASQTLEELDKMQHPDFFRANRQFLVHRKAIKNAVKYINRRLVLHLLIPFEEKIIISKEKASDFLGWLAQS